MAFFGNAQRFSRSDSTEPSSKSGKTKRPVSDVTAALKIFDGLYQIVDGLVSENPDLIETFKGNGVAKKAVRELSVGREQRSNRKTKGEPGELKQMRMDKNTFAEKPMLSCNEVIVMKEFIQHHEGLYIRAVNRVEAIVANQNVRYIGENQTGNEAFQTVFNKPTVGRASMNYLILTIVDLILFGYSVTAVKRDFGEYLEGAFVSGLYSPDLRTGKTKLVNSTARNRLPQRTNQTTAGVLPYSRVDITSGNLRHFVNVKENSNVFMFEPATPAAKAMEKHFRTFVIVNPKLHPEDGRLRTGLHGCYEAWSRYRGAMVRYQTSNLYNSKPLITVNYIPRNTTSKDMLPEELAGYVQHLGDVGDPNDPATRDQLELEIETRSSGKNTMKILKNLLFRGSNPSNQRIGRPSEIRQLASQGYSAISNNGRLAVSMGEISPQEWGKIEYDGLDKPEHIADVSDEIMLCAPRHTIIQSVQMPKLTKEEIEMFKALYEEKVDEMFEILIDPSSAVSQTKSNSSKANTATQIEASEMELRRAEETVLTMIKDVFDLVYTEWGAALDQMGLVELVKLIEQTITSLDLVEDLRLYIEEQTRLMKVKVSDIMKYLGDPDSREGIQKLKSFDKIPGKAEGAELVSFTLDTFEKWDSILKNKRAMEDLSLILHRALSIGTINNLRIMFSRKESSLPDEEEGGGGGGKDGSKKPKKAGGAAKSAKPPA